MLSRSKPLARMFLAMAMAVQATACSTPGYFVVPSVEVDAIYDDNIFFASEDPESDLIARVSPEIEIGYESETLQWSGRYRFDAEAYASNSELNDAQVRSLADLDVEYLASSRLTLSAAADYTRTDTPFDLSLVTGGAIPGLLIGRTEAKRTSLEAAAGYQFSRPVKGTLTVGTVNEKLLGNSQNDIHSFEVQIDQTLSRLSTLSYGNLYRQYRFDMAEEGTATERVSQDANTPWIGLAHQFNANTSFDGRAGLNIGGSSNSPYLQLSLRHLYSKGQASLTYENDEATLLGVPGAVEIQTVYGRISRRFGQRFEMELVPGYARISQTGLNVDIYSLALGAVYKFTESVQLTAAYDFNVQDASPAVGDRIEVSRNVLLLGLRFTYPRRGRL